MLRARLADGKFFFEEDKRVRLEDLYEKLEAVMFHKKLGQPEGQDRKNRTDRTCPLRLPSICPLVTR